MGFSPLLVVLSCLYIGANAAAIISNPTVTIASGVVIGKATSVFSAPTSTATVHNYLGIPFAAPPTGIRRFAPPIAPAAWSSPLHATKLPPACLQQFNYPADQAAFNRYAFGNPGGPPPPENEDCLYLNVFAPTSASPSNLKPVLFWVYGGNLQFGTGSIPYYDGSSFAGFQDVVVVTFNYRTNIFGFSGSPEIPAGQQNSGFLDQRFALQWVQDNIAKFGGNPAKVTIFGESAGGYSVKQLMANPPSPLPFRAAIMQSQQAGLTGTAQDSYAMTLAHFGCTTATSPIACLRAVPGTDIETFISQSSIDFPPTADNVTFVSDVRPSILTKKFADVPFLIGTNKDEGRVFLTAYGLGPANTSASVTELVSLIIPNNPALQAAVIQLYAPLGLTAYELASAVFTDLAFTCTTSALSRLAVLNDYKVWRYQYAAVFPNLGTFPDPGAYHTVEIPIAFGTYPVAGATADEEQLSAYMQGVWAGLAKTPSMGVPWPRLGTNLGLELGLLGGSANPSGEQTVTLSSVDYVCAVYAAAIAAEPL